MFPPCGNCGSIGPPVSGSQPKIRWERPVSRACGGVPAVRSQPAYHRPMPRVFAVANQKGGVAKTTTVHSLGAALAERGYRVLLVDLDPQACLTYSLGVDTDDLGGSLHDVIVHHTPAEHVVIKAGDLHLLPATIDLAGAEIYLLSKTGR